MTEQSLRLIANDGLDFYELRGDNTIKVKSSGHVSHMAAPGIIEERYMCFITGSRAVVMEDKRRLEQIGRLARLWHTETEREQCYWLEETARDEGGARRALVYDVYLDIKNEGNSSRVLNQAQVYGELVIVRGAAWESPDYEVITAAGQLTHGGTLDVSVKGTLPGRIARLLIDNPTQTTSVIWMGIREEGLGTANFVPFVECEDGTMGTDTAAAVVAAASDGNVASCTFATVETMTTRLTVKLSDFTGSNYEHMFGEYVVLLGYMMQDADSVVRVKISGGAVVSSTPILAATTSTFVATTEIGRVRIPLQSVRGNTSEVSFADIFFNVDAEILDYSGSPGVLQLDYICLIPAWHMVKMPLLTFGSDRRIMFYTHENGEQIAIRTDTTGAIISTTLPFLEIAPVDFYLPPGESVMVFLANRGVVGGIDEAATMDFTIHYYPRYESYRGVTGE